MNKEPKNKRKAWLILAASLLLLGAVGTMAYFTHSQMLKNSFTVGENSIVIEEDYKPPKEMTQGENRYEKKVRIKNTGTVPCFVRVFADFSDHDMKLLSEMSPDGASFYPAAEYPGHVPEGWTYVTKAESQILGGYYYYTRELSAREKTEPLFQEVRTTFPSADQIKDYEILVYAESVQVLDKNGATFTGPEPYRKAWTEFLERR